MAPEHPHDPRPRDAGEGAAGRGAHDALRALEQRLDRASEAAERLIAEAAATSASTASSAPRGSAEKPPPAGWQAPSDSPREPGAPGGDLELLAQVLQSLRDLIPPELQRRLAEALRELLMAVRALIDWYLERTERRTSEPTEVEDIPII
jgi:Spy/CpxP family protein refolding chaperone